YEVVATARRSESLDDLDVAERLALDVDDDASVAAAVESAGDLDVLVNNAGFGIAGPVEAVPIDEARRLFETNFFGAVRMIQAVVPRMRERGTGTVVNVSSVSGRVASPLSGFYSATKFALEAVSESLRYEVGHFGVRVVVVEPGFIETRFDDNRVMHGTDGPPYDELRAQWEAATERLNTGPPPGPELVAATIADAVEADEPKLRWPVGADADMALAARAQMDDETFEASMRSVLGLTW
ncbi:MAG: SDR family oxidoreductase, partial [Actinomycetota bacterium]|nr:SDR family oxidoreductase [Actinomycetota bacterium]